ncbi:hypothetical protein MRX96_003278 [Rhipicephalus microplus]
MSLAACASTGVGWVSSMTMMWPFLKVNAPRGGDDADDIETVPENIDLDDPVQLAIALNAMSKTIFFNEEGEQRPRALLIRDDGERSGELDDATAADKLIDQSHILHFAPGENRVPLALFMDAYAEELTFPTIYMGVPRKIIGPRSTPFAMASSEIRRTDRRGATPEHVLYMAAKMMRYNVAESNMMFRTNETTGSITREQLESGGKKFLEEVLDRDLVFMRGVPNTVQYWQDRRSELFAMIRQLGKPHAFLTMSASEVHWERLLETLERLRVGPDGTPRPVSEMMASECVELVNEDPVACAMYINRIFDVIMNVLADRNCSPFRPYVIRDYFKRVEFQQRGSAHVHVTLWLEEAPDEELTGEEGATPKTLEMVAQLLTLDTTLLRRRHTQTHQHTHTCYKRGRTKCQFGAPFMPSDETRIVVPFPPAPEGDDAESERERQRLKVLKKKYDEMHEGLESGDFEDLASFLRAFGLHSEKEYMDVLRAGLSRPCVLYRRTPAEKFVNAFNAWIGRFLDSNMDMQIILDHYACASNVVDYVNKSDRGMSNLKRTVAEILKTNPNDDIEAVIRKLRVDILKEIEMSAQEAAWFLLKQDMSHKSREVVYVPTCYLEERVRVRKTRAELEALPPGSTDVWKVNLVQNAGENKFKASNGHQMKIETISQQPTLAPWRRSRDGSAFSNR